MTEWTCLTESGPYHDLQSCYTDVHGKRPGLQTVVAFLTTRMFESNIDDWQKLGRWIRYLRGAKEIPLTPEIANDGIVR